MSAASNLKVAAQEIADQAPDVEWRVHHDSLASALVHALAELTVIEKGRTANAGSYSYDYADLGDIVKATRPVLARHGLVALTPLHSLGADLACSVVIVHEGGDRMDFGPFPFPHGRDAQATGSMVTYHRRYALLAALGMATGEDDDGAGAVPRQTQQAPAWTVADAKKRLLAAVGANDLAKQAWQDLDGDNRWREWEHQFPQADVEAWVNQPADGGDQEGDEARG